MIISVNGKINSGKDTVGQIIQFLTTPNGFGGMDIMTFLKKYEGKKVDTTFENKKFADKLKDIVCLLIGCTREQLEDRKFKEKELGEEWWYAVESQGEKKYLVPYLELNKFMDKKYIDTLTITKLTPRKLMLLLGTECGRDILHPNIWVNSLMSEYKVNLNHTKAEEKRLLSIWKNMNTRCTNPNYEKYHKYGGKGVSIYKEWKNFEKFKNWAILNGYTNSLTLDRKNTNGNYEPGNCRFVTTSLQAFNKNSYDGSSSNIKGVNFYPLTSKWQAQIQSKGIKQNLGYYKTEKLAQNAYLKEYNKILKMLEEESKNLQRNNYPDWVITDCRFKNELKAVEDRGGITIRVNRTYYTDDGLYIIGYDSTKKSHISETALDSAEFDYVVENKGTLEDLVEKIRIILVKEKVI